MIWWNKWAHEANLGHNIMSFNSLRIDNTRTAYQDYSIVLEELSFFLMLVSVGMALFVRRKIYEYFLLLHKYVGLTFYITAIIHAWSFWYFAAPALFLWLADKVSFAVRTARAWTPAVIEYRPQCGATIVRIPRDGLEHWPGQFYFVNVPGISLTQWHPITASASLDDTVVFHIKKMPNAVNNVETWSARLADYAMQSFNAPLTVRLGGPFGHASVEDCSRLLMLCGGIGITPMMSIFTSLRTRALRGPCGRLQSVCLVWMSRSVEEFRLFEDIFESIAVQTKLRRFSRIDESSTDDRDHDDAGCKFDLRLHCTRRESHASLTTSGSKDYVRLFVNVGRPDIHALFNEFAPGSHNPDTLVTVCGPPALAYDASAKAWQHGCAFSSEQFMF
eukprot:m.98994 g.98994  ORF g.98994 m.98994 type:complete len:390 (+) comp8707_c1_seq1:1-1170(+)